MKIAPLFPKAKITWVKVFTVVICLAFGGGSASAVRTLKMPDSQMNPSSLATAKQSLLEVPLSFELNEGQTVSSVQFLARGSGYNLFLTPDQAVLSLAKPAQESSVVRLKLVGSNPQARIKGEELLPGKVHYFIGNNPNQWHRNIPSYAKVRYSEIYPGIDLVYYGKEGRLEYDFVLKPGADANQIAFQIQGSDKISLEQGELVLQAGGDKLRQLTPRIYQRINGLETKISGSYVLRANNTIGFQLQGYDRQKTLIIDPALSYSTYLGGSALYDIATSIAADATGAVYVSGETNSANFPASPPFHNSIDVFVTKLSAQGQRVYSIFLGGTNIERSGGIAVSPSKSVYVTGTTFSGDFPRVKAIQSTLRGNSDAFVTQISPSGSSITFSTLFGGTDGGSVNGEGATGIDLDRARRIYFFGQTNSHDFPLKRPTQNHFAGGRGDGFVTVLSPAGNSVLFSTYAGTKFEDVLTSGTINLIRGDIYLAGKSGVDPFTSPDEPFLVHLKPKSQTNVSSALDSGYISDIIRIIKIFTWLKRNYSDPRIQFALNPPPIIRSSRVQNHNLASAGTVYFSIENCLTIGQSAAPCIDSGSIGVMDADLHPVSTIHFRGDVDSIRGMATDNHGGVYLTGTTGKANFPLVHPIQGGTFRGGNLDAFVMHFSPGATQILFSTFLGGNKNDRGYGIAVDPKGNMYVCGQTESTNFWKLHAIQGMRKGPNDGFVVKISP